MRKWAMLAALAACVAALSLPLRADELDDLRARIRQATASFKDMKATVVVVQSNRRELEKMGKAFAETYQFKKASVWFKSPDKLKMNGALGMMKVEFITADNMRLVRIPSIRYKKSEDITDTPQIRVTSLDVGVVSEGIWETYKVKLLRTEKNESGGTVYVLRLQAAKTGRSQIIWVDGATLKLLKRDKLHDDGTVIVRIVYFDHKQIDGVWIPTRGEVYNRDNKLAASTETRDIKINTGVDDKEFE